MSEVLRYIIFLVVVTVAIILVYLILKKSFARNRTIYLNNLEDLSTHYYRYLLYFWGVGILMPFSELYVDLFSIRAESELTFNLLIGAICLAIAYLSGYYIIIRKNLYKLFLLFFSIYNLVILFKIATYKGIDYLTLTEFTLMNMISYYVFYKIKYFYFYIGTCFAVLLTLVLSNTLPQKEFIIYFNSSFIAFIINFVIHHVDLNIKENLFFAYNYFNKGNQFIIGVDQDGLVSLASKNIDTFFGLNSNDFIGKKWDSEVKDKLGFEKNGDNSTLSLKLSGGSLKIIEWQEDTINHDLVIKIGRDITEIKRSETQITLSNNRLYSLISNMGDLVFVLNLDRVFTEYYQSENDEDLIVSPSFFLGKKINEIGFPDEAYHTINNAIEETIQKNKKSYVEYNLPSEIGASWFGVIVSPLCDESGQIKEVICIARNITTRKKDELELKKIKEVLEQTSREARMGGWEYDLIKQRIFSSKITKEIFEVSPDHESNFDQVINYFEEGEPRNLLLKSLGNCMNEGISYDLELPIITAKGNRLWVRAKGAAEFSNGVCIRIFGFVQDINLQVKAKIASEKSEAQFRYISENISDVVIVFEGKKVSYLSPTHQQQFGYSTEEAIAIAHNNIYDFFHPDDHDYLDKTYAEAIKNRTPKITYVTRFLHKNGSYIWREDSVRLIYDDKGYNTIRLITARDISERKNQELADSLRQEAAFKQNNILITLSKSRLNEGDFWNEGLFKITEAAAEGINVGRVSFWLYSENKIECKDLYVKESDAHSLSESIFEKDFPKYFEGLRGELAIIANDANTHLYTKEFSNAYLKSTNVKSMLDLPISIGGQLVGVICWEHQHENKNWTDEDISFAKSIADFISLEIEADKRFKAENALKRTKEVLEQTSRVAKVGAWEIDVQNQKMFFSDINKSTLEAPADFDLNLDSALAFFKEGKDRDLVFDSFTLCFKKGISFDIEIRIITFKNNEKWVRALGQAEYENGRCKRLYGTFQDISEQVNLVQIIKDKEQQYRSLLSNISSVTFRCANDASRTMIFISDAIEQLSGYPAEDFILNKKRSYIDLVFPEDRNFVDSNSNNNTEEYEIEYRIVNKSNEIVWIIEKGRRYYDEIEKRILLDGIISNITERKLTEIALVKSYEELKNTQSQLISTQLEQEKFVSLVKYSGAMIGMSDFSGKIIFLNEKAKHALGYDNLHGNLITRDFFTDSSKYLLDNLILPTVFEKGIWQGEQELINLNNDEIIITDSTIFIIRDPQNSSPVAIATIQIDITERKKAEAKLIENQKELLYKSELLAVVARSTERLLISTNIEETLAEIFNLIGDTIGADRIYYFENDISKNTTSQKTEWVREGILPEIDNPKLQNLLLENFGFFTEILLQNKVFKKIISEIEDPEVLEFLSSQGILSIILFPITIKDKFIGFIGFDDCTSEQIWSDDKINILFSLSTNVANAIERINNELIIRESEANFRQLNETLEDVFLLFDIAQNRYIYVSPSCKKVLGPDQSYFYNPNGFINDLIFEEDQPTKEQVFEQIYSNNSFELEFRIKTPDASQKWILMKSFGIRNEENEIVRISAICTDITERKKIQSEIKQLSLVAEKITNGVLIADTKGRVLWANQSFLDMMEIDLSNLLGKRPTELFNPKFKDSNIESEIINGNNFNVELEIETFKKTKKWIEIVNTSIKDDKDNFVQQIEVVIDITERKKVESLLIESEERYRFIAESTSDGIFVIENSRIVYTSPSFQKMFGYTFEESYKQSEGNLTDYVHPEDVENFRKNFKYHTGLKHDNFLLQYRTLHKNGNYIWREDTITAFYEGNNVFRFICVVRNISERVKVEHELVEERRLLRAIIDNIPVNVYVKDNSFKKILSNKTDVQFAGFQDEKSVLGKTDFELFNSDTAQNSYEQDVQVIKSKESIIGLETQLVKNDGKETWLLVSKIPLLNEKEEVTGLVGVSVDITERRKSQQLLLESERTLSSILNSLDEVVWAISLPDYKLVLISNSFDKVFGKSSKSWKRKFLLWKDVILPEDKWKGELIEKELKIHGQSYGVFRIKDTDGQIKWLENTVKIVWNEQEEPVMIMGTSTDITEKKNAEDALRTAQELADEANRLKAELELRALQMQMNPHFIFNALNSIQSYILNQDTTTANLYLTKFSRLIRLFLESSRSKFIPLFEEINLLTLYIELEKLRFDNKFEFEILFEGRVDKNIEIPTMILQPFIENAINHGLRYKLQKGLLSIKFYKEKNYLICTIEDDGVGRKNSEIIKDKPIEGYKSQGLKITAERLITYNKINDANIVFSVRDRIENPNSQNDEVGTIIEIRFPEI
ncbi:PAS domain S-box protein [Lacihabitans sp. CCS-44]|uniref:PAS domain S-box protein n=1 Tax=Lacihabitans sp. CCS-44 TaxID=2487331 RepID=UPI0020CEDD60|nr:PAS domain S-box protein [Lacihabitans sp. CCS-44]MCP9757149.1 PAS domain S-box protein [Lacihabitans sp. CCS-44]